MLHTRQACRLCRMSVAPCEVANAIDIPARIVVYGALRSTRACDCRGARYFVQCCRVLTLRPSLVLAIGVADASADRTRRSGRNGRRRRSAANDMRSVSRSKIRCHSSGPAIPTRTPPVAPSAVMAITITATADSERRRASVAVLRPPRSLHRTFKEAMDCWALRLCRCTVECADIGISIAAI